MCHCCLKTCNGIWPAFNSKTGCERHTQAQLFIDQGQSKLAKAYLNKHMGMTQNQTETVSVLEMPCQAEMGLRIDWKKMGRRPSGKSRNVVGCIHPQVSKEGTGGMPHSSRTPQSSKVKAPDSSETSRNINLATRRHIPEDQMVNIPLCKPKISPLSVLYYSVRKILSFVW